ncbi:tetratricopeptide repeat protein [Roseinatronobacter alkalisoli]|uniref:Cell division coordinator CpoB n=1 Tax=Roseinatronobacter alkalisoli TaxID=3028235 RepID=A0ABT5T5R3_9RHOB|nr:tetratricopeptide repeat protein [Roseinatronobacter sp. HJB301]MDD7970341.1 tetratricopeptide repeat protein [Roseinatronobacter sp. HJB301]
MRMLRITTIAILMLGPVSAPAFAQQTPPAAQQGDSVAQLRSEISALSALVAGLAAELSSGAGSPENLQGFDGSVIDQIERTRQELASLTARAEALEHRIRQVVDDASNRIGDMEFRLTELEGGDTSALPPTRPLGGGTGAAAATGNGVSDPEAAPQLAAGERAAFDAAQALIDEGDTDAAKSALSVFLETYPGSPLGAQASALLAQAQRDSGAESDAARTWLNLYLANPEGPDAPPALLELGNSLARLGQMAESCVMFEELFTRFPDAAQAVDAREAHGRNACP